MKNQKNCLVRADLKWKYFFSSIFLSPTLPSDQPEINQFQFISFWGKGKEREPFKHKCNISFSSLYFLKILFRFFFIIIKVPAKFRLHFRIPFLSELATHQKNLLVWFYHPLVNTSLSGSFRDAQPCNAVYGITLIFRQYQILSPSNPSNVGMKRPYPKCWDKREDKPAASGQAWDCPWTILL